MHRSTLNRTVISVYFFPIIFMINLFDEGTGAPAPTGDDPTPMPAAPAEPMPTSPEAPAEPMSA